MNNTVSVAGGKLLVNSDLDGALDVIAEAGFSVIDFWLCSYCKGADAPMKAKNWEEWLAGVGEEIAARGLSVGQVHAHWDHSHQIREDFTFEEPPEVVRRNFGAARMLGCTKLIFHPIQRWFRMPDESMRRPILDANVAWFASLLPEAEKTGVEIHIENLFDHKHVSVPGDPVFPFGQTEDLLYVADKLNHPLVKFCLDTGHANISGADIPAAIRAYGSRLGSLHLNDNYGKIAPIYEDVHLFPGLATIDWPAVFAALREVGYAGTLNMEPIAGLKKLPPELRVIHLRAARETVGTMEKLWG